MSRDHAAVARVNPAAQAEHQWFAPMEDRAVVLVVMAFSKGRDELLSKLDSLAVRMLQAEDCCQAREILQAHPAVEVVVTATTHSDGNWYNILQYLVDHNMHAGVIVTSASGDERLWSEVLWRGAYDLLVEPYDSEELARSVEGAVRRFETNG